MQQIAPMIGAEIFIEPGQTAEEIDYLVPADERKRDDDLPYPHV